MSQQKEGNPKEVEIRDKLEVCNLSALASRLGLHKNTLYRFRSGGNIGLRNAEKLFDFFNY